MWAANVKIINNTDYNITIEGVGPGNTSFGGGEQTSWTSSEVNNTKSLLFWKTQGVTYMQGNLSFGPEAGVYVDRGWMAENDQSIKMTAVAIEKTFVQTTNGGVELLAWNQFENGGAISLTFDPQ